MLTMLSMIHSFVCGGDVDLKARADNAEISKWSLRSGRTMQIRSGSGSPHPPSPERRLDAAGGLRRTRARSRSSREMATCGTRSPGYRAPEGAAHPGYAPKVGAFIWLRG